MILLALAALAPSAHAACPRDPDVTLSGSVDAASTLAGAITSTLDMGLPDLVVAVEGDHRTEGFARIDAGEDELSVTLCSASGADVLLPPLFVTGANLTLYLYDVVIDATITEDVAGLPGACALCAAEGATLEVEGLTIGSEGSSTSTGAGIWLEDASLYGSGITVENRVGGAALEAHALTQNIAIDISYSSFSANNDGVFSFQGSTRSAAMVSAALSDITLQSNRGGTSSLEMMGPVDATLTRTSLLNNTATSVAPIWVSGGHDGASLTWSGGTVAGIDGPMASFAVLEQLADPDGDGTSVEIRDTAFTLSSTSSAPAIVLRDGALFLHGSEVTWEPSWGTLVSIEDGAAATVASSEFLGEDHPLRSALFVSSGGDLRLLYNHFCRVGDGESASSVVAQAGYRDATVGALAAFNIFQDVALTAPLFQGASLSTEDAPLSLFHNTFAGIDAPSLTGGAILSLYAQNNLTAGLAGDGFNSAFGPESGNNLTSQASDDGHNLWFTLAGAAYPSGAASDAIGPDSDLLEDPGFVSSFAPSDCDTLPFLSSGSPARGAGAEITAAPFTALDGLDPSDLDIGATGGGAYWEDDSPDTGSDTGSDSGEDSGEEDSGAPVATDVTYWLGGTGCAAAGSSSGVAPLALLLSLAGLRRARRLA